MVESHAGETCLVTKTDGRQLRAAIALDACARAERLAVRLSRLLPQAAEPGETLSSVGTMVRSSVELERHLGPGAVAVVGGSSYLDRFATLRAMSSGAPMRLRTSVRDVRLDRDLARCVAMVVCELIEVVELAQDRPPDLMFAAEEEDGSLVVALAAIDGESHPVPTCEGALAFRRAERLVEACGGGLTRGVRDGMMLFGMAFPVTTVDVHQLLRASGRQSS